jgi:hypothetical protein
MTACLGSESRVDTRVPRCAGRRHDRFPGLQNQSSQRCQPPTFCTANVRFISEPLKTTAQERGRRSGLRRKPAHGSKEAAWSRAVCSSSRAWSKQVIRWCVSFQFQSHRSAVAFFRFGRFFTLAAQRMRSPKKNTGCDPTHRGRENGHAAAA